MSLRGSHKARVDDRSRIKVPAQFRRHVETTWGNEFFVTSLTGSEVLMVPLPVWEEFESRLLAMPLMKPARMRIQKVVNYFGQSQTMDGQGRVLIHSPLKERTDMSGEVMVLGYGNHLYVQNAERIAQDVDQSIESDLETLSELWSNE